MAEAKAESKQQIVEKIVEKTVVKREGVSEHVLKQLEEDARREKLELKQRAQAEMKALLAEQSKTDEERAKLERELAAKAQHKKQMAKAKAGMVAQLADLEKQLISGGQVIDKAAQQERELREAQGKIEEQKRQEMLLARELADKEDSNMLLEEQHASLQEEVDDKTRKLKKLWAKHKAAITEIEDLQQEFQAEKEDMLDTVRELTRQLKLKHVLLRHFVPLDEAAALEKRAQFDGETDEWRVARLEVKAASLRPKRPVSRRGARRVESEYARRNKLLDPSNSRWRADNVVQLDMEMPERRTKDFEPSGSMGPALAMNFWLDRVGITDDSELAFENDVDKAGPPAENGVKKEAAAATAPTETRDAERAASTTSTSSKEKSSKKSSSSGSTSSTSAATGSTSKRPPTASRRRRDGPSDE